MITSSRSSRTRHSECRVCAERRRVADGSIERARSHCPSLWYTSEGRGVATSTSCTTTYINRTLSKASTSTCIHRDFE